MQQKMRTIHVYFEEEGEQPPIIETDPGPDPNHPEPTRYRKLGVCCGTFLALLCIVIPILSTCLPQIYPNTYDAERSQTITLTLSQHPTASQLRLSALAPIKKTEQLTVTASSSIHQKATQATGLITFYNGSFSTQNIPAGTTLTGKSGVQVMTEQEAIIPPATSTTPPTYGTVSVTAHSTLSGTFGNIAASTIDQAYGPFLLAQNLYAFSGGQDEKNIPMLTKTDMSAGSQALTSQVSAAISDQAQAEVKPGYVMIPLDCSQSLQANHHAGDQEASAILTLAEICTPLVYFALDIAVLAQRLYKLPQGYHLLSFSAFVAQSNITTTGGNLIIRTIAYLKYNTPTVRTYHFAEK